MIESVIIKGKLGELIELLLWQECNKCHGDICAECKHTEECLEDDLLMCSCDKCKDKGRIPKYYTPCEFVKLTGIEIPDNFPVWFLNEGDWEKSVYGMVRGLVEFKNIPVVLNFIQKKPDINWRPK